MTIAKHSTPGRTSVKDGQALGDAKVAIDPMGDYRVYVDSLAKFNPDPDTTVMYYARFADNAGSFNMDVDGSVTNVVFDMGPNKAGDSRNWFIDHFGIQIDDLGNINLDDFGAIAGGLTNGILIQFKINGITHNFATIKNNRDVLAFFGNEGTLQNTGSGFVKGNFYQGAIGMQDPKMKLVSSEDDRIVITVRDDLTGLESLRFFMHYYHIIT